MTARTHRAPVLTEGWADQCPACGHFHGQPTTWPTCPEHGHHLTELQDGDNWTYYCPAWACTHTHTQQEKATMTTPGAALAIRDGQEMFDSKQRAALAMLGIDAPNAELAVFMHRCQATGLDPFAKQITMIKRREKVGKDEWRDKWTIQTEIDGYRLIASRAAKRDGVELSYGPTKWYDASGNAYELWLFPEPPTGATVTVYKDGRPFPGVAKFTSFAATTRDGQPMANWATMPDHMIAKCAEAQALRKAFPTDLADIATSDETARACRPPQRVTVEQVTAAKPQPEPEDTFTVHDAIATHFDRLGLEPAERDHYMRQLTHTGDLTTLVPADLEKALLGLESCEDIGQLREITGAAS